MRVSVRDTTALAVGAATSGLLAYVFFAVSTRGLGATDAAPVSVLWTYWSLTAAALTFPLQHWIARTVAADAGDGAGVGAGLGAGVGAGEGAVRAAMPRVLTMVAAVSVLTGLLAWLVRDALFGRGDLWFPVLVGAVTLGSALVGILRGGLSARHRFVAVAVALVAENALRCAGAIVLVGTATESAEGLGICLAAGGLVCLLWPSAFRFGPNTAAHPAESPLWFLGGASGGQLMGQAVLTGGPIVLALSGGTPAQVTALFAALALFRAPYTVAIGLVSKLTGRLTVLTVRGRRPELRRVRVQVLVGALAATTGAGVVGWLAGPGLLRLVFGPQVRMSGSLSAVVAAGSAVALASLVLAVMVMAQGRSGAVARAWAVAVLGGGVGFALLRVEPLPRTCWAFLVTEAVAFGALVVEELRGSARRTERGAPAAGSGP